MEDQEYQEPVLVSGSDGILRITCDRITVDFPSDGPAPRDAPPLARRIFEAFRHDLRADLRAE